MSKSDIVLPDFKYREYEEIKDSAGQPLTVIHPLHPDFPPQIRILKDEISLPAILYVCMCGEMLQFLTGPVWP